MPFKEIFPASGNLEAFERTIMGFQRGMIANVINIEARNAQMNGSDVNVNVAEFDPQNLRSQVRKNLKFIKKSDATVDVLSQMANEGRTQVGGDMIIFIENAVSTILIFGKMT